MEHSCRLQSIWRYTLCRDDGLALVDLTYEDVKTIAYLPLTVDVEPTAWVAEFSPEVARELRDRAKELNQTPAEFVVTVVRDYLQLPLSLKMGETLVINSRETL